MVSTTTGTSLARLQRWRNLNENCAVCGSGIGVGNIFVRSAGETGGRAECAESELVGIGRHRVRARGGTRWHGGSGARQARGRTREERRSEEIRAADGRRSQQGGR